MFARPIKTRARLCMFVCVLFAFCSHIKISRSYENRSNGLLRTYVRAQFYCASLLRTLFIGHARATSFSSARTESKTQQNIELMTFALTWRANIFVERSVTPTFFRQIASFSDPFHYTKKQKEICAWELSIISHILFKKGRIGTWIQVCVT